MSHLRVCSTCGNTIAENGICLNCHKNDVQRDKKYRTGDHVATKVVGHDASLRGLDAERKLSDILSGEWVCGKPQLRIIIDLARGSYRSFVQDQERYSSRGLRVDSDGRDYLSFTAGDRTVEVRIGQDGRALLKGRRSDRSAPDTEYRFLKRLDSNECKICPTCLALCLDDAEVCVECPQTFQESG